MDRFVFVVTPGDLFGLAFMGIFIVWLVVWFGIDMVKESRRRRRRKAELEREAGR